MPTLVSVVIPVFNAAATIAEQLAALGRQTYAGEWEIVVADNGSTDDTAAIVDAYRSELPALRVVDASARSGPAFARNTGARLARGDFIAFCDADDVVADRWLEALVVASTAFDVVTGIEDAERLNSETVQSWRSPRAEGLPRGRFRPCSRRSADSGPSTARRRTSTGRGARSCSRTRSASRPTRSCTTATGRRRGVSPARVSPPACRRRACIATTANRACDTPNSGKWYADGSGCSSGRRISFLLSGAGYGFAVRRRQRVG